VTRDLSDSTVHSGQDGRGGALDLLRFVAAFLIVLYHFGTEAPIALADLHPVFGRGYLATDFFLILSGYVLGRAYGRQILSGRVGVRDFMRKRLTRIWPAQLMVLAALASVYGLATLVGISERNPGNYTALAFLMQGFLVQGWGLPGGGGWNHPSWSLSALVVCYAAFPFAWRWITRITSPLALLALGLAAVMAGDLICLRVFQHSLYDLDFSLGVVRTAPLFLLGICIARVVEQGRPGIGAAKGLACLAVAGFVGLQIAGRFDLPSIVAIAAIVLALGRLPVARPSAVIEHAAKLSFALFVTHTLTGMIWFGGLNALHNVLPLTPWLHWVLWGASLPLALVTAGLFHRFFDAPVQAWLTRRRPAGRAPAEASSAA